MRRPRQPLFLARAVYRKRRLRDAARMLPVLGLVALQLPMMWPPSGYGWVYVFAIWFGLIVLAAILARALRGDDTRGGDDAL